MRLWLKAIWQTMKSILGYVLVFGIFIGVSIAGGVFLDWILTDILPQQIAVSVLLVLLVGLVIAFFWSIISSFVSSVKKNYRRLKAREEAEEIIRRRYGGDIDH